MHLQKNKNNFLVKKTSQQQIAISPVHYKPPPSKSQNQILNLARFSLQKSHQKNICQTEQRNNLKIKLTNQKSYQEEILPLSNDQKEKPIVTPVKKYFQDVPEIKDLKDERNQKKLQKMFQKMEITHKSISLNRRQTPQSLRQIEICNEQPYFYKQQQLDEKKEEQNDQSNNNSKLSIEKFSKIKQQSQMFFEEYKKEYSPPKIHNFLENYENKLDELFKDNSPNKNDNQSKFTKFTMKDFLKQINEPNNKSNQNSIHSLSQLPNKKESLSIKNAKTIVLKRDKNIALNEGRLSQSNQSILEIGLNSKQFKNQKSQKQDLYHSQNFNLMQGKVPKMKSSLNLASGNQQQDQRQQEKSQQQQQQQQLSSQINQQFYQNIQIVFTPSCVTYSQPPKAKILLKRC